MKKITVIILVLLMALLSKNAETQVVFGVFADCQFCDCETAGTRFYRNAYHKLEEAINYFNQNEDIEFVVNLGDLIDRDFESYNLIKPVLQKSEKKIYHVPGNHDFSVEPELKHKIHEQLELEEKMYYSVKKDNWMLIFLDGNDVSVFSGSEAKTETAKKISDRLKAEGKPNYHTWNAAIGDEQMEWMKSRLQDAKSQNLNVALFCHYPVLPYEAHTLWNQDEVVSILEQYDNVKLWMNGHNHAGNYAFHSGIHFVNLKGMIETEKENAYSKITLTDNTIYIKGFGREADRQLEIK